MMKERARSPDEIVREFYGIDPSTFKVDNVAVTRSGKISRWTTRGYRIQQSTGIDYRAQVVLTTGLIMLVELDPATTNDARHSVLAELRERASKLLESYTAIRLMNDHHN